MMERIGSLLIKVKEVVGVDFNFLSDGKISLSTVLLKKDKKTVHIQEKKEQVISSINELNTFLPRNTPLSISINGKNILHKKIKLEELENREINELVNIAFPSINPDDFYIQEFGFKDGMFLSLIRKNVLDDFISNIKAQGFEVLSLSLGPFEMNNFLGVIEALEEKILCGQLQLQIKENEIIDFKTLPEPKYSRDVKIGDELIGDKFLLAYSTALNHYLDLPSPVRLSVNAIKNGYEEWRQKQFFHKIGWGLLVAFFIILLGNFFVFSNLNEKNASLLTSLDYNETILDEMKELQKQVSNKKAFLKGSGWLNNSKSSFYADRIANTVPVEITLYEMSINPLDEKRSRTEKKPVILNNCIIIKGGCKDPALLNSWLGKIKEFDWVNDIREQNYSYDANKRTGFFDFKIETK